SIGRISADGGLGFGGGGGGGSGGGIYLYVGRLTGTDVISANGSAGDLPYGGGGGGGRIAILYGTNQFRGSVSARGGAGATYGGAGTVYYKAYRPEEMLPQILVDNGGARGTNTPVSLTSPGLASSYDLTVSGGAMVHHPAAQTLRHL